jgi:hypothetical protein
VAHGGEIYIGEPIMKGAVEGIQKSAELKRALEEKIKEALQAVAEAKTQFADAFGALADAALQAFDAKMAAWVPPAQTLLNKMQLDDQKKQYKDAVNKAAADVDAANQALTDALAGGDPEEIQKAYAAQLTAQQAFEDAVRAQQEFNLSLRAEAQQKAHDKRMKQQRRHLMEELAQVEEWLAKHPAEWEKGQQKVLAVLAKYHIKGGPFWNEGLAFAEALRGGLLSKLDDLRAAGQQLASALAAVPVGANMARGFDQAASSGSALAKTINTQVTPAAADLKNVSERTRELWQWFASTGLALWKKIAKELPPMLAAVTEPFEHLRGVLVGILGAMKQIIDKAKEFQAAMALVTTASGGTPPGRQHGGPVKKGSAYVVGEGGPELFIPNISGTVVPGSTNGTPVSSGGGVVNVYVAGSVVTERDLRDYLQATLLKQQRLNVNLGF